MVYKHRFRSSKINLGRRDWKSSNFWGEETGKAATAINFSSSSFNENISINSVVSTLSSSDNDPLDTHTYSLVNGSGDTDNSLFSIDGDQLTINESPNYEEKSSYKIRIQSTDSYGNT